jgi:hypothetical protein
MLLAFVVIVIISLMSPLCDCAWPETEIALGSPCSFDAECQPGPFTHSRHCCVGPSNGKYCSGCCVDDDCGAGRICIPLGWMQTDLASHTRGCVRSKVLASSAPCFRNEQCASMLCNGGLGASGDKVNYPLGNCA